MCYRSRKLDVTHSLSSYFCSCALDAALVANLTLVAVFVELAAGAFPVLCRSENSFAEKTVSLRLERAVIYCLRLCDFAVRPLSDLVR